MSYDKILVKVIILLLSLFFWGCQVTEKQADSITLSAQLIRVVSGQTIEVIIPQQNNQLQQVRLIGIDVPKLEENGWDDQQAKAKLREMLADNVVTLELETNERDRYNRLLAHVWHNNTLISEQLAQRGYAIANTKYPHQYSDRIFHAQEYARILGYGIWHKKS